MSEELFRTKADIKRISTGIQDLDEHIEGGIPQHNSILLKGESGTLKTSIALNLLLQEIIKQKHVALYISLEESFESLHNHMLAMDFPLLDFSIIHLRDLAEFEKDINKIHAYSDVGCLVIIDYTTIEKVADLPEGNEENTSWLNVIKNLVKKIRSDVRLETIAIDDTNALCEVTQFAKPEARIRDFVRFNKERQVRTVLIQDVTNNHCSIEKIFDTVFKIEKQNYGRKILRELSIEKMRYTKHELDKHTLEWKNGTPLVKDSGDNPLI